MTDAELQRVTHRLADAALMAHDALKQGDMDALVRACEIAATHVATIRAAIRTQRGAQ